MLRSQKSRKRWRPFDNKWKTCAKFAQRSTPHQQLLIHLLTGKSTMQCLNYPLHKVSILSWCKNKSMSGWPRIFLQGHGRSSPTTKMR
eukprot:332330-Karenia_brevis.AAC.1